jgi:hypothetical protein
MKNPTLSADLFIVVLFLFVCLFACLGFFVCSIVGKGKV